MTPGLAIDIPPRKVPWPEPFRAAGLAEMPALPRLVVVFALHALLGLAMHRLSPLATLHTFSTVLAVLAAALYTKNPAVVLMCAAYVSGSEVLWRMSKSYTFHETAKYTVTLLCLIGLVRLRKVRLPGPAVLYLALLLPAAVFPFVYFPFDTFRKQVMFHLSGPVCIAFCIVYCANVRISLTELWRVVLGFVAPLCGVAAVTVFSSYLREVRFTTDSNFQTSGGFGPNQVASSLALGALMLVLAVLLGKMPWKVRLLLTLTGAVFVVQSAMTFSRGGLASSAVALALAFPFALSGHRYKKHILAGMITLSVLLAVALPLVNAYTGGKLAERFTEKQMSGREELAEADWLVFQEFPVFGVGVGISRFFHPGGTTAHTEFTRAMAEHGLLGIVAYLALFWLLFRRSAAILRDPANRPLRAFLVALMAWPLLYMVVNAMRTSAPAFALGLAFLTIAPIVAPGQEQKFLR
jgi:O-antigen ligase